MVLLGDDQDGELHERDLVRLLAGQFTAPKPRAVGSYRLRMSGEGDLAPVGRERYGKYAA